MWMILTLFHLNQQKPTCTSSLDCPELNYLCVPGEQEQTSTCLKGKEISQQCNSDEECYSKSCDLESGTCWCPTPESCLGCNSGRGAPCLRVENISPKAVDICSLQVADGLGKSSGKISLFDVGAAHSVTYDNLYRVIGSSSGNKHCFSIQPFMNIESAEEQRYRPGFVQASMNVKKDTDELNGEIVLKGHLNNYENMIGLQLFVDGHWIANIEESDVYPKRGKSAEVSGERDLKKDNPPRETVKAFYSRISISWEELKTKNVTKMVETNGKMFVVEISGSRTLDFDIPEDMGIEFVGNGIDSTVLYVHGNVSVRGRASFQKMTVSFEEGSLFVDGPTFFKSCMLVEINSCPYPFIEFDGLCFLISDFIEQADDTEKYCQRYERATLATKSEAAAFILSGESSLNRGMKAWIHPGPSECVSIDGNGIVRNESNGQNCDDFIQVLCVATPKKPIYGKTFTSYFSDQFVGTYKQDFYKRVVDKERLPFQLGGTLTFTQVDFDTEANMDRNGTFFAAPGSISLGSNHTVSDSRPIAIGIDVTLQRGNIREMEYAFDTYNEIGFDGFMWSVTDDTFQLPTKFQIHSKADVCISKIDVSVYNETGHKSTVTSIQASMLTNCFDYNVCSASDKVSCGRSLAYYDEVNQCVMLRVGSALVPQDLSIDLLSTYCTRLTTWTHEHLGSPFLIEANFNGNFKVNAIFEPRHQYDFSAEESNFLLEESNVLPTDFDVIGQGQLKVFKITRYGKTISFVDFSHLWKCINMCSAFGTKFAISLSKLSSVQLKLVDAVECQKLVSVNVITANDFSVEGKEVCTSPPMIVESIADILDHLQGITSPDQPYRTISLNLNRTITNNGIVLKVPKNRGLTLSQSFDLIREPFAIEDFVLEVQTFAECHLDDLQIKKSSQLTVKDDAKVFITGCEIDSTSTPLPFLSNAGSVDIVSTKLLGTTLLENIRKGSIDQMYVQFYDSATILNKSEKNVISFSRTTVYENFTMNNVDWANFNENFMGKLELPDVIRFYNSIDDEVDGRCMGIDQPDRIMEGVTEQQCRQACENEFVCSGMLTYFEDRLPMCGLCLREEHCSFDCSTFEGGAYFIAGSNFDFTKVKACPYISRPFKNVKGTTLEECKLFCSYYRPCEGFIVTEDYSCNLIADLDFAEICYDDDKLDVYIPYVQSSVVDYRHVKGSLIVEAPIASHEGYSLSECSAICLKTMSCVSFDFSQSLCILFNERDFNFADDITLTSSNGILVSTATRTSIEKKKNKKNKNKKSGKVSTLPSVTPSDMPSQFPSLQPSYLVEPEGLYILIGDFFPKKRYMVYESCYLQDAYTTYNVKSVKRCKNICDGDYSCSGFVFRPLTTFIDDNCELYHREHLVNRVFGPDIGCHEQPKRRIPKEHLEESLLEDTSDGIVFTSKRGKSSKSQPTSKPSFIPSRSPSRSPTNMPSLVPSDRPSVSSSPSLSPSDNPTLSPSVSQEPSTTPSVSVRPSQVSETYDLYVAYVEEIYTEFNGDGAKSLHSYTVANEDECKTLCFFESNCIAMSLRNNATTCDILGQLKNNRNYERNLNDENTDVTYLLLDSKQHDSESRYVSTIACFEAESLTTTAVVTEGTFGFFRMPRTCTHLTPGSPLYYKTPSECGLECSKDENCLGFVYFVDYNGSNNQEKIGSCGFVSSPFDMGACNGVENNSDLYFRADVGAACQASCNIHFLCSSFVFGEGTCELFSDIALFAECDENSTPKLVHVGLSYRARDGLVQAPRQSLIEYEELREIGCYDTTSLEGKIDFSDSRMTPFLCQKFCKDNDEEHYAVKGGQHCTCGSVDYMRLPVAENKTESCGTPCFGDSLQTCGGDDFASVGFTGRPLSGLTLSQCKRECFKSYLCEAIVFQEIDDFSTCEFRSHGTFQTSSDSSETIYIESLEHYYTSPVASYFGSRFIRNATVDLKQDCHILCDTYDDCETVKYDDIASVNNCELFGGNMIYLETGEIVQGIEVANDVNLYTRGFTKEGLTILTTFNTTFDLDECRTLCEQHVECGSLEFVSPTCTLFNKNDFVNVSYDRINYQEDPHYIAYGYFVDPGKEFHSTPLCIDNQNDNLIYQRSTSQSKHDCADRCNAIKECTVFSYNYNTTTCKLFGELSSLETCVNEPDSTETFIMFTRGKFTQIESGSCLQNENDLRFIQFSNKNPLECMALCDKWFNCRSFRSEEQTGSCKLYESEQYTQECEVLPGNLFIYYSDQFFSRLDENFYVGTNPITSIDDTPIEVCKTICNLVESCLSFEHTQNGNCVLYSSADFKSRDNSDQGKDLYISFKSVVAPESRYLFRELSSCFNVTNDDLIANIDDEMSCKAHCENYEDCLGIQISDNRTGCYKVGEVQFMSQILQAGECEGQSTFLKTKINPYKKHDNTCLQNRIDFNGKKILDKEDYECMSLCNHHPSCRYFIYGDKIKSTDPEHEKHPELRECLFFEAQGREVDDCDGDYDGYRDDYEGLVAYVNGR